jgi:hypothetical protein
MKKYILQHLNFNKQVMKAVVTAKSRVSLLNQKYGNPFTPEGLQKVHTHLRLWEYPAIIQDKIPSLGKSVYMNVDFIPFYHAFLLNLIMNDLHKEIYDNDQCFNVRPIRGATNALSPSMHSWALAVDLNPAQNSLGKSYDQLVAMGKKPFSDAFINIARNCGLIAGADFTRNDRMHFELDLRILM